MKTIKNDIQEAYCSFEVSELLKKNGFNQVCNKAFLLKDVNGIPVLQDVKSDSYRGIGCPTQAIAIEWVRVNFDIFIGVNEICGKRSYYPIFSNGELLNNLNYPHLNEYRSPQEATDAALLSFLKKL